MNEDEIRNIVIKGYKDILGREPDPGGLSNYVNEIRNGLSIDSFQQVLRSSGEYRKRTGVGMGVGIEKIENEVGVNKNDNEIKNVIIKGYKDILGREPDPGGLSNYVNEIKGGLSIDKFHEILKESDEYKKKSAGYIRPGGGGSGVVQKYGDIKDAEIVWCQVTCPSDIELTKDFAKKIMDKTCKYVNRGIVVCDEEVKEDDKAYLRNLGCDVHTSKWEDSTSKQRNVYLEVLKSGAGESNKSNIWACVNDPDEPYPDILINDLRQIIASAQNQGVTMLELHSHDIWLNPDGTEEECEGEKEIITDFWKSAIFVIGPGAIYTGQIHEALSGYPWIAKRCDPKYYYYHKKKRNAVWKNAVRNYFCEGGGVNLGFTMPGETPEWFEFRAICSAIGINSWKELEAYLKVGNIDQRLKDWIIRYKDINTKNWHSEIREIYLYYFKVLHPEEEQRE